MAAPQQVNHRLLFLVAALVAFIIAAVLAFATNQGLDNILGVIAVGLGCTTVAAL